MQSALRRFDNNDLENEFKKVSEDLVALLSEAGLKTRAYHTGFPFFGILPIEKKQQVVEHLRFYFNLCSAQISEGNSLRDSQTFTWRALKACGLVPGSNFIDLISSGDIVEIYMDDHRQIFRNLEFFELCSYTLEELYCYEWWRLFERDPIVTEGLMKSATEIFSGLHPKGISYPTGRHVMREIASFEKYQLSMEFKFVGPLMTNKSVKGLLCIESGSLLHSQDN